MEEQELIAEFHRLFYSKGQFQMKVGGEEDSVLVQMDAKYCGISVQKNPLDLWVYQEILWDTKPDLVIEMGTASGGTTLFLAHQLDKIGHGRILSVDIVERRFQLPKHFRIHYALGDSLAVYRTADLFASVRVDRKDGNGLRSPSVMVILDDDHSSDHVSRELELYNGLVTKGQYLIVEDTNIDSPLNFGEGPGKAVKEFLKTHDEFEVDRRREKFLMTWNPGGYLRRK